MSRHLNIRISGKVQGVFFRASSKEIADSLGVFGFVQNEKNHSVYIEAEGAQEKLDQFVKWCHKGPPRAVVSNVNVADSTVVGFRSFDIRR
jgi:acylphosphatase